jgi:hypothetical protein
VLPLEVMLIPVPPVMSPVPDTLNAEAVLKFNPRADVIVPLFVTVGAFKVIIDAPTDLPLGTSIVPAVMVTSPPGVMTPDVTLILSTVIVLPEVMLTKLFDAAVPVIVPVLTLPTALMVKLEVPAATVKPVPV